MKVMQMIGSLALGGGERMAVNLSNALLDEGVDVYLCTSRSGGGLEAFVSKEVKRYNMNRRKTFDLVAIFKLAKYVRAEKIDIIHAHSFSFFVASVVAALTGVKVFWHDHYGDSENLESRKTWPTKLASLYFSGVIVVNESLLSWVECKLFVKNKPVEFISNFPSLPDVLSGSDLKLQGEKKYRICCAARLHPQKDHMNLLRAFLKVVETFPQAHLFLIGQDSNDDYSSDLKQYVSRNGLSDNLHFLGACENVAEIYEKVTIGVLSSESEGLPVALLEYGLAGLAVVATNVGACAEVLKNGELGGVVPIKNSESLSNALIKLLRNDEFRGAQSKKYHEHVVTNYSGASAAKKVIEIYKKVL